MLVLSDSAIATPQGEPNNVSLNTNEACDIGEIIRALHESKICGGVAWAYDDVWIVTLTSMASGITLQETVRGIDAAAEWLRNVAVEHYPDSVFARWYR